MDISPDQTVLLDLGAVKINATLVYTWLTLALLAGLARWITHQLSTTGELSPWQNLLEVLVEGVQRQIRDIARQDPGPFLPFIATLFLFIATCNLLAIVPGYEPPTGSLSTTTALALCVFLAVPFYGIRRHGLRGFLHLYLEPTPLMLPLNLIGELARTVALAVRLYGNVMSGSLAAAILLLVTPWVFPALMHALELLTGLIQAYIFAVLATVFIAAAAAAQEQTANPSQSRA
ncbi:MAG: F0F1 ATP synthase subunit A [Candidatus Contendobacter sp.]|nr:F0F1 ATP synthase subunit A [Candidatus Contendobacter sp.]MDS4060485.1 F0F1 ATP synthase subunit A [Candidatus Contendobacter sp.]